MMEDNRMKHHNFYFKSYPYTIEYEVTVHYDFTMFFPGWEPQDDEKLSVEKSSYSFICAPDYQFRFKAFNLKKEPAVLLDKGKRTTTWSIENMPAYLDEPLSPPGYEINTVVFFAPTDFQVGDYKGNMNTWSDYGKFNYALKKGRDVLPPRIREAVHQLTDAIPDPAEKIRVLYNYLQQNTRYVGIQLGIGGWQPFDASYVGTYGYGDCKALSNYMYSMLKEIGIPSYYTLINAGDGGLLLPDFPMAYFNHVTLCVPLGHDSIWLECTDQTKPAGYLGFFTGDRYCLLVSEDGGKLVHTPAYAIGNNLEHRNIEASLDENANLQVKVVTAYHDLQQDQLRYLINELSKDKVKEYLQRKFDFATYDLDNFNYVEKKSAHPEIDETLGIYVSNYATITGKRLFIAPNVMTRWSRKLKPDETRKYDIVIKTAWRDVDTVNIEIPKGYEIESLPAAVTIDGAFGRYRNEIKIEGNVIHYYRLQEEFSGRYPAKNYGDLVKFYDAIYKADRNRVVFVKSGSN
jgi:transglutaminase-like putative cysteine protease